MPLRTSFDAFRFTLSVSFLLSIFGFPQPSCSRSLHDLLAQYDKFSAFKTLLNENLAIHDMLVTGTSHTLFVPDNNAMSESSVLALSPTDQQNFVRYHVVNGSFNSDSFSALGGRTVQTYLLAENLALLAGDPNAIYVSKFGDDGLGAQTDTPVVYSGLGGQSRVTDSDLIYDQGIVHGINQSFTFPQNCSHTAEVFNLSRFLRALDRTGLTVPYDTTPRITCFAPIDSAWVTVGSPDENQDASSLNETLHHHLLQGNFIGYTDHFQDGAQYDAMYGGKITVTKGNGSVYVDGVKIVKANVITNNGVAHFLDGVLKSSNDDSHSDDGNSTATQTPQPTKGQGVKGGAAMTICRREVMGLLAMGSILWGLV